jgi:D-alanyl-D-alanine carboxypeptidase/D-alanyl-D-alanine-endopeptidase (penicillin-binding protein 4)
VLDVLVTPTKEGEAAKVLIRPTTASITVTTDVKTTAGNGGFVRLRATGPSAYHVTGSIGAQATPTVRIIDVADPTAFARTLFIERLHAAGINVTADPRQPAKPLPEQAKYQALEPVASYQSEPLADVLTVTLKVSHNLYASTLPILVGQKHGFGTIERGLRQQGKVLEQLGVDPLAVSFAGGAGGAQADSVTPRATVKLLQAMAKHQHAEVYFNALPVLGVDGTLADVVAKDSPAHGKVRAKTGTLSWVDALNNRTLMRSKALAGELTTSKGTKLYFAMFLNDVPLAPGNTPALQGKVLGRICEVIHQYGP